MNKWYKSTEWQLCIKEQGIMWLGSLNIPQACSHKEETGSKKKRRRRRRQWGDTEREEKEQWLLPSLPLAHSLYLCEHLQELFIHYPATNLMSQASSPWHFRSARQPLLRCRGTLAHTRSYTKHSELGHRRSSQQLHDGGSKQKKINK